MSDAQSAVLFFLQLGVILLICRLVGWLVAHAGQPQVVGEMVAGFLMGPSFFGGLAPGLHAHLFPAASLRVLFVVSQLGLVLYMFCVGMEFDVRLILQHGRRAAAVSLAGIGAPFALGGLLAVALVHHGGLFADRVLVPQAVLFMGAATSITAFPMLARIIYERGISGTSLGNLALAAGALDDAAAWIFLAIVVGDFTGNGMLGVFAAGGGLVYAAVVYWIGRPVFQRVARGAERAGELSPWMFMMVLAALAIGAWFTDLVGIYSVFGAFILGAAIPRGLLSDSLQRLIEPITTAALLPLFFVYSGLNTRLGLVNSGALWLITAAVMLAACMGKGVACWAAARLTGASQRDALGVATLMNARGLMELILLNIALQRGIITPALFTIMVLMAIGTTVVAGPLFSFVYRPEPRVLDVPAASAEGV